VKFSISLAALTATAALAMPVAGLAAPPEFRIPDYSHLRSKATETVDVDVGGFLLALARMVTREEAKHDSPLRVLDDIKSVKVRSYKFDSDEGYSRADVDAARKQLQGPQWNAMVQVHKRDAQEDVDVYVCVEDSGKTCGLAVIATQPREFTVVSIVGSIDIDRLADLEGEFGIPKVSQNSNSSAE
jgi:hypothetical protein